MAPTTSTPGSKILLQPTPQQGKKKHANSTAKKGPNSHACNPPPRQILGKKPKLDSISMGDLVQFNKIIPKRKDKVAGVELKKLPASAAFDKDSSDFPALSSGRGGNWPSLGDPQPAKNQQAPHAHAAPAKKPGDLRQQNNSNSNNNNNHPKKRKNVAQQVPEFKVGKAKRKDSNAFNSNSSHEIRSKLDKSHLQAQFLLPPGKLIDNNRIHPSFQAHESGTDGFAQLMLTMKQGQIVKGRQRIKPRKKKFTALKRKILLERLRVWKELNPDPSESKAKGSSLSTDDAEALTVCIYGFVTPEELEDDDEYNELESNFKDMAEKFGAFEKIYIPRDSTQEDDAAEPEQPVFVQYATPAEAMAARHCWDGLVIGGQPLTAALISVENGSEETSEETWRRGCVKAARNRNCEPTTNVHASTCRVLVKGVATGSSVGYGDLKSIREDLKGIAEKFGRVKDIQIDQERDAVILYEGGQDIGNTAAEGLQSVGVDASVLSAEIPLEKCTSPSHEVTELRLDNVLTEDDLGDEECLEESLNDVRSLLSKYGKVSNLVSLGTSVVVSFIGMTEVALRKAAAEVDGTCLGGQLVTATVQCNRDVVGSRSYNVVLRNLLTEDDIEDDECLEESLDDVRELASRYGNMKGIQANKTESATSSTVIISYSTVAEAEEAALGFDGLVIGGQKVEVVTETVGKASLPSFLPVGAATPAQPRAVPKEPKPMFSGDKRISERFAECKRVPKIPNKGEPRSYAVLINDDTVKPLLIEMLNELMRLQLRGLDDKNAKARRRVVFGLREVARGLRANKAKMIVMANNLDEYGAVDGKLEEILALAEEKAVPVLFELSKRILGKAVGKKIKVSVVAIQGTDGAHQQFVKLKNLANRGGGASK
jgi:ribosomal protein L7Ae-like RNA K-turn-binding protein